MTRFPEVQEALVKAQAAYAIRTGNRLTRQVIADGTDVSLAAVSTWFRGEKRPGPDKAPILANMIWPNDSAEQATFIGKMRGTLSPPRRQRSQDPLEDLLANRLGLKVGLVNYGPFSKVESSQPEGFLGDLGKTFAAYAQLGLAEKRTFQAVTLEHVESALCEDGSCHLVLGIFAT